MAQRLRPDRWLFGAVVALLSVGLVMVYSASTIVAGQRLGDPNFFLKRQVLWAAIGVAGLVLASATDYRRLERLGPPLLVASAVLLALVLLPSLGHAINGTRRWLRVGGLSMQPVELAKFAFIAYAARVLARWPEGLARFRPGVAGLTAIGGGLAALVLKQPDLGNCLTLLALLFLLLFLAGARPRHLLLLAAPATAAMAVAIWTAPYRWRRLTAFLDPEADRLGSGFQIIQSSLALGSGGVLGRGLGASKQKLFYLPEPHTDFVFAVIGEELGLVGTLTVVGLFAIVLWRGVRIGLRA
jgi:cell division protein FtsW